jgi:SAM-dependent methyltransferase
MSSDHERQMWDNAAALEATAPAYFRWNLELFRLPTGARILDLGTGPGLYTRTILDTRPELFVATDVSQDYVDHMARRLAGLPHCHVHRLDLLDPASAEVLADYRFDHVTCFDVLEHIGDDARALTTAADILRRTGGGRLGLRVPALGWLYGTNDRVIGHHRRYTRSSLVRLAEGCGLVVERSGYQNLPGIVPWLVIGRVLRRGQAVSAGEGRAFDRLVPLIRTVERVLPPPLGLSVWASCRFEG